MRVLILISLIIIAIAQNLSKPKDAIIEKEKSQRNLEGTNEYCITQGGTSTTRSKKDIYDEVIDKYNSDTNSVECGANGKGWLNMDGICFKKKDGKREPIKLYTRDECLNARTELEKTHCVLMITKEQCDELNREFTTYNTTSFCQIKLGDEINVELRNKYGIGNDITKMDENVCTQKLHGTFFAKCNPTGRLDLIENIREECKTESSNYWQGKECSDKSYETKETCEGNKKIWELGICTDFKKITEGKCSSGYYSFRILLFIVSLILII